MPNLRLGCDCGPVKAPRNPRRWRPVLKRIIRPETPPEVLSHPKFQRMRQEYLEFLRLPEDRRIQTRPPDRHLPDVPGLLEAVAAPFKGKCAFCAVEVAKQLFRFRPTSFAIGGEVMFRDGSTHPHHYGWLADAWQNLYPICYGCMPRQKNYFPVVGPRSDTPTAGVYAQYTIENSGFWRLPIHEEAMLIDPCNNNPTLALKLSTTGILVGKTLSGTLTIDFFNLNRPELIRARAVKTTATRSARAIKKTVAPAPQTAPDWQLARIRIENFKAIETLDLDIPARPDTRPARAAALLILGENAAGKSTILEAVALAMMPAPARRKLLKKPASFLLNPQYMGNADLPARRESTITLDFTAIGQAAQIVASLTAEGMAVKTTGKALPQVFAYGAYRHYLDGVQKRGADRGVVTLFRSDSLLSNPRDWLMQLPADRFNEVIAALRFVFGVDFDAIRRSDTDCSVVISSAGVETQTPLLAVSSGFRTVLALVCDVLRWLIDAPATRAMPLAEMPALILIDEVEAHLHPRWKMAIVDGLRRALPAATFLITTHDPLCLRRAAPDEVRVMTRSLAEGRTELPILVEAMDGLPETGTLTVDQLLTADFFGLGDTDDPATLRALEALAAQYGAEKAGQGAGTAADLTAADVTAAEAVVQRLQRQLLHDLPIGRTEVERIVQQALNAYLTERRSAQPKWRDETRARILNILRGGHAQS